MKRFTVALSRALRHSDELVAWVLVVLRRGIGARD
jgi:hypothetical protein